MFPIFLSLGINKLLYTFKYCYNITGFWFRVVGDIFKKIEQGIKNSSLLADFQMNELPIIHDKLVHLVEFLVIILWLFRY